MNSSLSLSFELIYLIGWLLKNEKRMLNSMIKHAVKNGLAHDLQSINSDDQSKMAEELYNTILDFLVFLEDSLADNLDNLTLDMKTEKVIHPALKKFDQDNIDLHTLKVSLQQTKTELCKKNEKENNTTTEEAKTVLFQHILKNWKPSKNETYH